MFSLHLSFWKVLKMTKTSGSLRPGSNSCPLQGRRSGCGWDTRPTGSLGIRSCKGRSSRTAAVILLPPRVSLSPKTTALGVHLRHPDRLLQVATGRSLGRAPTSDVAFICKDPAEKWAKVNPGSLRPVVSLGAGLGVGGPGYKEPAPPGLP